MKNFILLGVILIIHALILTKLIFFPYPELFIYPYLTNQGLKPYQQILDQHFPGLMFLPINFDNLGMNTPEIARIWSISLVILIHLMLFVISSKVLKSRIKAIVVNLLYLIWQPFFEGWVLWIDSFLPIILLLAFYALYQRRIFLTGLLLGMGIVFKQVLIPLSGLVLIYIFWERKKIKDIYKYVCGLFPPIILMLVYFLIQGTLKDFWYWTVIFNLTIYAKYGKKFVPTIAHLTRVGFVFGISIIVLLFRKKILSKDNRLIHLLLIFLFGSLAGTLARFDFVHFQPALPFAILGVFYSISRFWKSGIFRILGVGYILITVWWLAIFYRGHISDKVFFFDEQTKLIATKIKQYTKEDDKIFVFGAPPHLYQMADRLPAGNLFVFQFPWFLKVAEDRLLEGLKKDRPQIVVTDRTVEIEGHKLINFATKLDSFIQSNYQTFDVVENTQIMRKVTR